jgi:hypothetical protein
LTGTSPGRTLGLTRRLLVCAVVAVIAGCGGGHGDDDQGPFAYDAKAPLDIREQGSWNSGDMTVHSITYARRVAASPPSCWFRRGRGRSQA